MIKSFSGGHMLEKKRVYYYDYLKIFASFAVVMIHISANQVGNVDVLSNDWNVIKFYDGLQRWAVPVFVMISGALFLGRKISLRRLYSKSILKMFIVYGVWSLLYAFWSMFMDNNYSVNLLIQKAILGHYHTWFLLMIAGLYMIIPLVNMIVQNKTMMIYFLVLAFFFSIAIPEFNNIIKYAVPKMSETVTLLLSKMNIHLVLGYTGYFLFGYFLSRKEISRNVEFLIYCLGIIGAIITVVGTAWFSYWLQAPVLIFHDSFTINSLFVATAVYIFFKQHLNKPSKTIKNQDRFVLLSKCTFGVYLIHPVFIDIFCRYFGITTLSVNPIISVPLLTLAVYLVTFAASVTLNKIPFINKWIV